MAKWNQSFLPIFRFYKSVQLREVKGTKIKMWFNFAEGVPEAREAEVLPRVTELVQV